jgi:hypothetical protein
MLFFFLRFCCVVALSLACRLKMIGAQERTGLIRVGCAGVYGSVDERSLAVAPSGFDICGHISGADRPRLSGCCHAIGQGLLLAELFALATGDVVHSIASHT